ncbi:hypothetical protein ACEW7V_01810 [Areca yellow leaf disease phytoplasma]
MQIAIEETYRRRKIQQKNTPNNERIHQLF